MIRIFGNLWLPDPEQVLPAQELSNTRKLLALIQACEARQVGEVRAHVINDQKSVLKWNLNEAFECFRKKEVAWWLARGVARPVEYLVRPSGGLDAPIACHLYNPTFSVDDPSCQETEDFSNASLLQLKRAGFSTEKNCFIFDHLARRDVSKHCRNVYPDDLLDIHEEFLFALRAAMEAKVEICWGANVRERMLKKLRLEPLRLWGQFSGLVVYLELTPQKTSLIRFVIFVAHPQRFMYVKSDGNNARAWRERFGAPQDDALHVAAQLCNVQITPSFYGQDSQLLQNLCVPREISARRNLWKGQAVAQLTKALPNAVLSVEASHRIRVSDEDRAALRGVFAQTKPGKISEVATVPDLHNDRIMRDIRLRKIADYCTNLRTLLSTFTYPRAVGCHKQQTGILHIIDILSDSLPDELHDLDCWDWEELPGPVADFIQLQDGLKFNKRKITCRDDLELAFRLLQRCEGNPGSFNIFALAASVLVAYGWMITRSRRPSVDGKLILRGPPYDVVSRKCSGCGKQHLDDPFAYWSKFDPDRYITWYYWKSSCGRPDCMAKNVHLVPLDISIKHIRASKEGLEEQNVNRFGFWFLLRPTEYGTLPSEMEVVCQGKDCRETRTVRARWTGEPIPRFVVAVHKCIKSGKRTDWLPTGYPYTRSANLSRLWHDFGKNQGFDITCYPRRPDIYFNEGLSIAGRIAALIEAQKLLEDGRLVTRKRSASEMDGEAR